MEHELVPASALQGPAIRDALLDQVPFLFGINEASWCAQRSLSRPFEAWDVLLDIMDRLAMDTNGSYTESIHALVRRSPGRTVPKARVLAVFRRLGPSLPDKAAVTWRFLVNSLGETSSQ